MMVKILTPGPRIFEGEIDELEAMFGRELPIDYKEFLRTHNGGAPEPNVVDISPAPESPTDIQIFLGFRRGHESSNIAWNLDFLNEVLNTKRFCPIARDSGGNLFCIDLSNEESYGVCYFDLSKGNYIPYKLVETFTEFLIKILDH